MTIGRSFLLWLLGVLVVTLVLVSGLVLWHEKRVLEDELRARSTLLARTLAAAMAGGGAPEFLAIATVGDLRAGEVRSADGQLLWRYGPPLDEAAILESSLLRVEEAVIVGRGPWGEVDTLEVVLLVSRARIDRVLAASAVRLVTGLAVALTLALLVGLGLVGRVVRPLRALADSVRAFRFDRPLELEISDADPTELRELAQAFGDMTRRLAEQRRELETSERRYRELFAESPTPLLELDRKARIRGANPASAAFLGRDGEAAAGTPVASLVEGLDDERLLADIEPAASGEEAALEARWRLPGGELAEVELHVRPAGDDRDPGYLMAIHDLTDRVRRLGELWRRTFDAMVDGVALVDETGGIVLANQAIQQHLEMLRPSLADQIDTASASDWRLRSGDRLLQCSLTSPEGLGHGILVARDVTEGVRAEARLREAEKMQAVGTLASGVAHDFNNLLAAIQLHLRWLERDPEGAADAGAAIRDLAEEGVEVVRELLLFARRESTPPRTLDLAALVAGHEGVLRHLIPDRVSLKLELVGHPVPIVGNPVGLRRLILNLVLNARDAVARKGGMVEIGVDDSDGRAVLTVADDGPGIPAEHRERLFEPFFTLRRHGRGAGLGLAVVYAIVNEHGGQVDLLSEERVGTRFVVTFPLGRAADLEPLESGADDPDDRLDSRVLLVDDDGRQAARVVELLAEAGLEVRHASDLATARRIVEQWMPAAVVTVTELPDGAAAPWLGEVDLPAVIWKAGDDGDLADSGRPPRAVILERTAAPEILLSALQRMGVAVLR